MVRDQFPSSGGYIEQFTKDYKVEIHKIGSKKYYVSIRTFNAEFDNYETLLNNVLGLEGNEISVRYATRGLGTKKGAVASRRGGKSQKVLKLYTEASRLMEEARFFVEQRAIQVINAKKEAQEAEDAKKRADGEALYKARQAEQAILREAHEKAIEEERKARYREYLRLQRENMTSADRRREEKALRLREIETKYEEEIGKLVDRELNLDYIRIKSELPTALTNPEVIDKLSRLLASVPSLWNERGVPVEAKPERYDAEKVIMRVFESIIYGAGEGRTRIVESERNNLFEEKEEAQKIVSDEYD